MPKDSSDSDIFKIRKRLRLYGKPSSKDLICREISKLLLGDSNKNQDPISKADIGRKLGYGRTQIHEYCKLAEKLGYLEIDEDGKAKLPKIIKNFNWHEYNIKHRITTDPDMLIWIDKLKLRKGGKLTLLKPMVSIIEKICNTCKITPSEILNKKSAEAFKTAYLNAVMDGKGWTRTGKKYTIPSLEHLDLRVSYAIASFCAVHGISWEKGTTEMSRKIVGHGNYSSTKLTSEEFKNADIWIRKHFGLDSDLYRWFWVAIESGARFTALYEMPLEWTVHKTKSGKTTFIMKVVEGKTRHINKGVWIKYIRRSKLQKSLTLLKNRGGTRIFESKLPPTAFRDELHSNLKKLYDYLGKNGYFHEHPTHVLRHLACHRLLQKGNYTNHSLVAKMLGWNVVDEMIKSYGEIPPEKVLEEADKFEDDFDEDEESSVKKD